MTTVETLSEAWMKLDPTYRRKLMAATSEPQLLREFTTKEGARVRVTFSLVFPQEPSDEA